MERKRSGIVIGGYRQGNNTKKALRYPLMD